MQVRVIEYTYDEKTRCIVLPEGAPFDSKPVLIKLAQGWCEAWWCPQEGHGEDAEGYCWVCLDAQFEADLDDAKEWAELPK